jgi:hypothetical protein
MKKLPSITAIIVLASGLILGSIGILVPVVAQTPSDTNATNATSGGGANATSGGNDTGNPLSNIPIIGDILGGK